MDDVVQFVFSFDKVDAFRMSAVGCETMVVGDEFDPEILN